MATRFPKLSIAVPAILILGLDRRRHPPMPRSRPTARSARASSSRGPEFDIGADLGRQAGRNLFHSFERFSLATGERATFSGPDQIRNVISRVTGGERSDIDGTIRSTIAGRRLLLHQPRRRAVRPERQPRRQRLVPRLDRRRAALSATARTSAPTRRAASSFTVAAPEAFGFLGAGPAPILVDRSTLEVPPARRSRIVGGDINIDGGDPRARASFAPRLARSRSRPRAARVRCGSGAAPSMPSGRPTFRLTAHSSDTSGNGGGKIIVRGGRLLVDNSVIRSGQ